MVIAFDQFFAVKPEMPLGRKGDSSPARPQPGEEPFYKMPIAPTLAERCRFTMIGCLLSQPPMSAVVSGADIVKLEAGGETINPASFQAALDFVNKREDPSDFYLTVLMRLYYLNRGKWLKFLPVALKVDSIGRKEKIQ